MKKMIRFTLLLLMITGVFIFSSGEKISAATDSYQGFTVYSYTTSDTTHTISQVNANEYMIFINGQLIYSLGSDLTGGDYYYDFNSEYHHIMFANNSSGDSIIINKNGIVANDIGEDFVLIKVDDPDSFDAWGFQATDTTHPFNLSQLILNDLIILSEGTLIYEFGQIQTVGYFVSLDETQLFIQTPIDGDSFKYDNTTSFNSEVNYVIIQRLVPEEYTITFNTNGGTAIAPVVVEEGSNLSEAITTATTKEGYTFDDWYKNAGLTIPVTESDTVTSDITVYAGWIENIVNYTVTFNTNGGSYIAPQSIVSGEQASRPTDPVKTGYTFNGWYTEMFFINLYNFNSAVSDNITLYAQWTLAEDPIEDEDDAWDVVVANLPWIILGLIFVAIIFKR